MLKIVGDICLTDDYFDIGWGVGSSICKGNNPFAYLTKAEDDIWIGNCECVISDTSIFSNNKANCFRISPSMLRNCRFIDYYCVANNHVMEHGVDAYNETCSNLENISSGIFGSLDKKSVLFEHQKKKVTITAFSLRLDNQIEGNTLYWNFPELSEIENEYNRLVADFKIVYIHWGVEFINYPSISQRLLAHWLIDLGFDLVVGMHPHVLQGFEIYKGKYIYYSIGNFVFNMSWRPAHYSVILNVDLLANVISHQYVKIDKAYHPIILQSDRIPYDFKFEHINKFIQKSNPESYVRHSYFFLQEYQRSNRFSVLKNFYKYKYSVLTDMLMEFCKRRLFCRFN